MLLLISIWAMTTGLLRIAASSRLREELSGEILLAMSGAIAVLFALALLLSPVPDALAFRWVIGGYAIAVGLLHLMLGFELRYMKTLLAP